MQTADLLDQALGSDSATPADPDAGENWAARWLEKFPGRKFMLLIDTRNNNKRALLAVGPESAWHELLPDSQIVYIRPSQTAEPLLPADAIEIDYDGGDEAIEGEFRVESDQLLLASPPCQDFAPQAAEPDRQ